LIGHGDVGSGIDCRSLLLVDVSFHRQLRPDHLRDELMFLAHKRHHFRGRGDRLVRSLGCVPPLGCHRKSGSADHRQSRRQQTLPLGHLQELRSKRFKRRIEIQTLVWEKAKARMGKICGFFDAEVLPPTAGQPAGDAEGRLTESADRVGTHVHWWSTAQALDRWHRVSHQAAKIELVPILKAWCPFAAMIARHLNHWESGNSAHKFDPTVGARAATGI
jgi:hypothetical protein